jgi:acyl-CoA thioesterase I
MRKLFIVFLVFVQSLIAREAGLWVIVLGDSLTEGLGVRRQSTYPFLLEEGLAANGFGASVINAGVSGSTSAGAARRLQTYLDQSPEVLVLALGANDGLRGLPLINMEKNLSEVIDLAQSHSMQVVLAGMKIPPNYGREYANKFKRVFSKLAQKYSLPWIPFLLEGVAGIRSLNQADGIHPNAEGHKIIAKTVLSKILEVLKSKSSESIQIAP